MNAAGLHALVVDSFGPRDETAICTQRAGSRITQAERRRDALAALDWLARRREVDATRLGLLGWSNGGSTVLAATNLRQREVAAATVRPAFAVAFHPGCEAERQRGYRGAAPLLMLLGEADDLDRPGALPGARRPAVRVRRVDRGRDLCRCRPRLDSTEPVRWLRDVPVGVHPGQGVHVGGDARALRRSRERLLGFLATAVSPPGPSSAASPPRPPPTTAAP